MSEKLIVLVGGEKGGTGKTTIATNIAAMFSASGKEVILIDTDPQGSASDWATIRNDEPSLKRITCFQKFGKGLPAEIRAISKHYDVVVIDAGGRESAELRASMTVANIGVFPVQPSQFDLWTIKKLSELVTAARGFNPDMKAITLISRASTNASSQDANNAQELLADYPELTLSECIIRDRVSFRRASGSGMSVQEFGNDERAEFEIKRLFDEVIEAGKEFGYVHK